MLTAQIKSLITSREFCNCGTFSDDSFHRNTDRWILLFVFVANLLPILVWREANALIDVFVRQGKKKKNVSLMLHKKLQCVRLSLDEDSEWHSNEIVQLCVSGSWANIRRFGPVSPGFARFRNLDNTMLAYFSGPIESAPVRGKV